MSYLTLLLFAEAFFIVYFGFRLIHLRHEIKELEAEYQLLVHELQALLDECREMERGLLPLSCCA